METIDVVGQEGWKKKKRTWKLRSLAPENMTVPICSNPQVADGCCYLMLMNSKAFINFK